MTAHTSSVKDGGRGVGLERDVIVTEALRLLDEAGFSGLTVRRLADRLKVKAAALYWHFENKQDLIDAIAERIMTAEFRRQDHHISEMGWRELLTLVARTNRGALMRYRDGAQIMAHANMGQAHMLEGMETLLVALQAQGFSLQQAMVSFFVIIRYTLGYVFEEQADPHTSDRHKQQVARIHELRGTFPMIAEAVSAFRGAAGNDPAFIFEQGLAVVLDGVGHQLEAAR